MDILRIIGFAAAIGTAAGFMAPPGRILIATEGSAMIRGTVRSAGEGLVDVFVYVKDGLPKDRKFDPPKDPVTLEQQKGTFLPRVFGIQTGQELRIVNSDDKAHNVYIKAARNKRINRTQHPNGPAITRKFDTPEVFVEFKCDRHPWEKAHAGVLNHPFFAVTKQDGVFEIKGLPPGRYELEAKHPRLGTRARAVDVEVGKSVVVEFAYEMK